MFKLHNPSYNEISDKEPGRLEKETRYCTPVKGAFVKARGERGDHLDQSASNTGSDIIKIDFIQLPVNSQIQLFSKYTELSIKRQTIGGIPFCMENNDFRMSPPEGRSFHIQVPRAL